MSRLIRISSLLSTNYGLLRQTRLSSSICKQSVFFDSEVQSLMKKLTGLNLDKVFRRRKLGKTPERPIYQFMTQEVRWGNVLQQIIKNILSVRNWRRLKQKSWQRLK